MLKGIDPRLTPETIYALAQMGHGDDVAIVDANFPAHAIAQLRPGHLVLPIAGRLIGAVNCVLSVIPLDTFVPAAATIMQVVDDPDALPEPIADIMPAIANAGSELQSVGRYDFYELARTSFFILQTQDNRLYGNVILKKGVIGVR